MNRKGRDARHPFVDESSLNARQGRGCAAHTCCGRWAAKTLILINLLLATTHSAACAEPNGPIVRRANASRTAGRGEGGGRSTIESAELVDWLGDWCESVGRARCERGQRAVARRLERSGGERRVPCDRLATLDDQHRRRPVGDGQSDRPPPRGVRATGQCRSLEGRPVLFARYPQDQRAGEAQTLLRRQRSRANVDFHPQQRERHRDDDHGRSLLLAHCPHRRSPKQARILKKCYAASESQSITSS